MSEIQKCPNLVRGGGGQYFSKMSQIQKCPKCRKGGGSTLIWTLSQIFLIFYFDGSPNRFCKKKEELQMSHGISSSPKAKTPLRCSMKVNTVEALRGY